MSKTVFITGANGGFGRLTTSSLLEAGHRVVATMRNIEESLAKMASGMLPVIDTEVPLAEVERGLARLESRQVFGKIVVTF